MILLWAAIGSWLYLLTGAIFAVGWWGEIGALAAEDAPVNVILGTGIFLMFVLAALLWPLVIGWRVVSFVARGIAGRRKHK